ncbi:MAG: alcohol dehydrogenase catalytic domain-containing protein, partial [Eubacteriales bacterium]
MKAMLVDAEKHLIWSDVPEPVLEDDRVLIEIEAAALNRADLLQRLGTYPSPKGWPQWMGLEVAGYISAVGRIAAANSSLKVGDPVCALLGGGGYAQRVAVPYRMVMPIPRGLSMPEAAS